MHKNIIIILAALFVLLFQSSVFAQEVTVQGTGKSCKEAVDKALYSALEYTVGTLASAPELSVKHSLVVSEIYGQAKEYITGFETIDEEHSLSSCKATLIVDIDTGPDSKLVTKLKQMRLINIVHSNPRIAIVITDYSTEKTVEGAVAKRLAASGFTKIVGIKNDVSMYYHKNARSVGANGKNGGYLKDVPADFLIIGEIVNNKPDRETRPLGTMFAARLIKVDTNEVIAVRTVNVNHAEDIFAKAGEQIGEQMAEELFAYADRPESGFRLIVANVDTFSRMVDLENHLKDIKGVKNIYIREYLETTAIIDIDAAVDTKIFSELLLKEVKYITITDITGSSIKMRFN